MSVGAWRFTPDEVIFNDVAVSKKNNKAVWQWREYWEHVEEVMERRVDCYLIYQYLFEFCAI